MSPPISFLSAPQVAAGTRCPLDNVKKQWPLVVAALNEFKVHTPRVEVAVAANIAEETRYTFLPCREQWARGMTEEQYFSRYAPPHPVAAILGNRNLQDAVDFRGGGLNQLTGRLNFLNCGNALGVDLITVPEQILDPRISARSVAWFVATHGHYLMPRHYGKFVEFADAGNWLLCRETWNGAENGAREVIQTCEILDAQLPEQPPTPEPVTP